jgi:hypothetical protein
MESDVAFSTVSRKVGLKGGSLELPDQRVVRENQHLVFA